jgi:hypothetical protein
MEEISSLVSGLAPSLTTTHSKSLRVWESKLGIAIAPSSFGLLYVAVIIVMNSVTSTHQLINLVWVAHFSPVWDTFFVAFAVNRTWHDRHCTRLWGYLGCNLRVCGLDEPLWGYIARF